MLSWTRRSQPDFDTRLLVPPHVGAKERVATRFWASPCVRRLAAGLSSAYSASGRLNLTVPSFSQKRALIHFVTWSKKFFSLFPYCPGVVSQAVQGDMPCVAPSMTMNSLSRLADRS